MKSCEYDRAQDAGERYDIVPARHFSQIDIGKNSEDYQGHDLLNDLELVGRERSIADTICWNLKAVLGKSDQPAHENNEQ